MSATGLARALCTVARPYHTRTRSLTPARGVEMYATKRFHNGTDTGFIGVGTPYLQRKANSTLDPTYVPARYVGKQFACEKTDGIFTNYGYKPDPYNDRTRYLESQPLDSRKLGFGSHDAWKRTEFTNTPRARQHAEVVQRETRWMNKWNPTDVERMPSSRPATTASQYRERRARSMSRRPLTQGGGRRGGGGDQGLLPPLFQEDVSRHLYDIGRTRSGTTKHCYKCARDTFFCKHRVGVDGHKRVEIIGTYGYGTSKMPPPAKTFARVSQTKAFLDGGHLH